MLSSSKRRSPGDREAKERRRGCTPAAEVRMLDGWTAASCVVTSLGPLSAAQIAARRRQQALPCPCADVLFAGSFFDEHLLG